MSRALWTLVLLLGCAGGDKGAGDGGGDGADGSDGADGADGTEGGDGADGGEVGPQPAFANPPEAIDEDDDPDVVHYTLTAGTAVHDIVDWPHGETASFDGYAYNGGLPGPTLRAKVGDTVIVDIINDLDTPTTVHWHGIAVPYAYDGVTWSDAPIAPGDHFRVEFVATEAGVAWYHPHFDTELQVDRGLYGVFIIEDPADPPVDRELIMVIDDWAVGVDLPDDAGHVHGARGAEGLWTVNGLVRPALALSAGETVRVRAVLTSNEGYVKLDAADVAFDMVGRDTVALPVPEAPDTEVMAPGDRLDMLWRVGSDSFTLFDHPYSLHGGDSIGEPAALMDVVVTGDADVPALSGWPTTAVLPSEDPPYTDLHYTFQGDPNSDVWRINGERFPDVTVPQLALGTEVIVQVRNVSATEHPFHVHGLHFEVLSIDGVPPAQRTIEDNVNIGIYETVRLKVVADNPGFWMTHCHILPHADGGMMTVIEVAE